MYGLFTAAFYLIFKIALAYIMSQIISGFTRGDRGGGDFSDIGHMTCDCSTDFILPLIYGRGRVGNNRVFASTTGSNNQYLHLILEMGEGPIEGIVREDGSTFTATATEFPEDNPPLLYLDGELWTKWGSDYVYAEFFSGTATQDVCATLHAADASWNDPKRYTAYMYVRLKYNMDKFQTIPDVTAKVDGLQLYDPTTNSTAYSQNFALMLYDLMTRPGFRGGLGLDNWHASPPADARIDIDSVEAARAYCAAKEWTGGLVIKADVDFAEKATLICDCFRGAVIYSETVFKVTFRDLNYESSVSDIEETDVVTENGRTSLQIKPAADLYDVPNAVEVEYYCAENNYQTARYLFTDADAIAADGDVRRAHIKLMGLNTLEKVEPMVGYHLERARWGHVASLSVRDAFANLEALDLVTLTHSMPGWDSIDMRVMSVGFDPDTWTIQLDLLEEAEDLYDDEYNPSELTWHTTNLPDPTDDYVQGVINASISEETFNMRLRSYTRLVVEFDRPTAYPWWDYAQVWLKIGSGEWAYMTKSENGWLLEPVEEGETYAVKLVSVNIWGAAENFDNAVTLERLVLGVSSMPDDVTGLTAAANGDSVAIYAALLEAADIEGYEVRLGDAWAGGLFVSFNKAPTLRLNGVRPGTHTFWMAARDNSGTYSVSPQSVAVRVFIPPGFTSAHSWELDFTTGTFDNTEHDTYDTDDILKCSHAASVEISAFDDALSAFDDALSAFDSGADQETSLSGTWTSPTYDMGSLTTVRVWGSFDTTLIAGSSTWDGVIPTPAKWEAIDIASRTWAQIFQPAEAARLEATLQFSEDGSSWSEVGRFEILCAEVYARYLRIVVRITDFSADTYLYLHPISMSVYTGPS